MLSASSSVCSTTKLGVLGGAAVYSVVELGVAPVPPSLAAAMVAELLMAVPTLSGDFTLTSKVITQLVPTCTVAPVIVSCVLVLLLVELPQLLWVTLVRFCVSVSIVSVIATPVACPLPVFIVVIV